VGKVLADDGLGPVEIVLTIAYVHPREATTD